MLYWLLALYSEYWFGIVVHTRIGQDFFIYYNAYANALSGGNPYLPYHIGESFVNHPFVLSIVSLFAWHQDKISALLLWMGASLVCLFVVIKCILDLAQTYLKKDVITNQKVLFSTGLAILIGFGPFLETMHTGQINIFALLSILLMYYYAESNQPVLSGIFLSLAIALKTSPVIFVLYFLSLRNYRLLVSCALSFLLLGAIPTIQFSSDIIPSFLTFLSQLGSEIHPSRNNHSILALATRVFPKIGLQGYDAMLTIGHKFAGLIVVGAMLFPNVTVRPSQSLRFCQFALLLLAMTLFSPLVWYHHSMFLIVPIVLLFLQDNNNYSIAGIALILLIQLERLFENKVVNFPFPILVAHYVLLGLVLTIYVKTWSRHQAQYTMS